MSADSGVATEYMSNAQQTLYVFVIGTFIRTIYVYVTITVFTFRLKNVHIYPDYTYNITSAKV